MLSVLKGWIWCSWRAVGPVNPWGLCSTGQFVCQQTAPFNRSSCRSRAQSI